MAANQRVSRRWGDIRSGADLDAGCEAFGVAEDHGAPPAAAPARAYLMACQPL